jgi:hypothetical protein
MRNIEMGRQGRGIKKTKTNVKMGREGRGMGRKDKDECEDGRNREEE